MSAGTAELRHTYCCRCHAFGFALSLLSSAGSPGPEVPLSREEEVDSTLLKNDSGVESALLYAKAWSKYIKDLLAWMEKRLAMGETHIFFYCFWPFDCWSGSEMAIFGHAEQLDSQIFPHISCCVEEYKIYPKTYCVIIVFQVSRSKYFKDESLYTSYLTDYTNHQTIYLNNPAEEHS